MPDGDGRRGGGVSAAAPPPATPTPPAVPTPPEPDEGPPFSQRPLFLRGWFILVVFLVVVGVIVVLAFTTGLVTDVRGLIAGIAKTVEHAFVVYGYPIVFLAVLGESAGLPLPGETILLIAGVAAQHGSLALPVVWLLGAAAAIVGDNLGYVVGHYGGRPLLERYGRILRVRDRELRILDRYFEAHGAKTVFLGRWVIFLRVWAALFAGAARMQWRRFFLYNALGGTAWVISMSTLAYIFSSSISRLKGVFGVLAWALAIAVGVFIIVFVAREQRKSLEKYAQEEDEAGDVHGAGATEPPVDAEGEGSSAGPTEAAPSATGPGPDAAPADEAGTVTYDATASPDGGPSLDSAP